MPDIVCNINYFYLYDVSEAGCASVVSLEGRKNGTQLVPLARASPVIETGPLKQAQWSRIISLFYT